MDEPHRYRTSDALRAAIAARAKRYAEDGSMTAAQHIRQFDFSRLLARIFHEADRDEWILKGGLAALVRIPDARITRDMDLMSVEGDLDAAVVRLVEKMSVDLDDHYEFTLAKETSIEAKPDQQGVSGRKLSIGVKCGKVRPNIQIDLVTDSVMTTGPEVAVSKAISVPGITPPTVRLYPLVDHIADKIAATHADYSGERSTRVRDMVDLVLFALTHTVDGSDLRRAIGARRERFLPHGASSFDPPSQWRTKYPQLALTVPLLAGYADFDKARALLAEFLVPALAGTVDGSTWNPAARRWGPVAAHAESGPS